MVNSRLITHPGMAESARKTYQDLARIVKGIANHRRIEILDLLNRMPESSLADISKNLHINFKTASEHVRKLSIAGLIVKRYEGQTVRHRATLLGMQVLKFLKTLA